MQIKDLILLLKKNYVNLTKVDSKERLNTTQDSYLVDKNDKIIGLNLKNIDLLEIYKNILKIESLLYLNLINVNIKNLESVNFLCKNLQSLDLSFNGLKEFPKEIVELKNLQSLDLSRNEFTALPKEIVELKNLQSLYLSGNGFTALPKEIVELKNLQSLNLSFNGLKEFPKEIVELKNLQSLDLSRNEFTALPKEIVELKNLQSLYLSFNGLKEFPKEIVELKNLQSLNLSGNELKELPKEIVELKNLQSLNLSGNGFTALPKEIVELKNLQSLNLSGNELKEFPKEIVELKNLQSLDLSGNEFTALPKEIVELKNLQSLYLSFNGLKEFPKEIVELKNLQSLYLSGNGFTALPKEIVELKNLQSLNLSGNELKEFPKEIVELKNLQSLNLSRNGFTALPKEIVELKNLQSLYLSGNGFTALPKEIVELKNLQSLDLSRNGLKEFPKEIVELKNLQSLNLSFNGFTALPKEIVELKNLQSLNLSFNGFTALPKEIVELKNLQSLYLSFNGLKEFPKEIVELKNLQSLNLSGNGFTALPKEIVELKNLQSLYLSGNGFTALPKEIVELKNLQSLDLSRNGLKEFPKEITKLSRLSSLHFSSFFKDKDSNKIKSIPNEFIELTVLFDFNIEADSLDTFYKTSYKSGLENLKNTIQQKIKQGTDKLYEAKLLFVGESGAGKTSLMEKILDKKYQLKTSENDNSTIGIDIRKHTFPYTKNKKIIFRTNMWDFGGQQVQYMSHQFFLTPNSLYVLVGDNRKQHTDFDYWFHIINLLSDDSPILVVLNDINHKSVTNFDLKAFKERFNTHTIEQKDIDLSNIVDGRYDELKLKIENMLCNLPHIGEDLPARWIDIRDQINILAESNYFIPFEEFRQISEGFGLSDEDISTLARHFHNLGVFLHYGDDISGLADTIFLNPKWVMDAIYSVLADTSVNQNNGKFTKKWLFNFWEEQHQGYTLDIKNKLLTLMLKDKFEICYRLQTGKESYMSPQLLPPVLDYEYEWDYKNNLFYRFQYPFMPRGIISRLIVRLNNLIYQKNNKEIVWQKGVVLEYENAKAEVREKKTKEGLKVIDISIKGDKIDSSTLLSKIKSEIENIHNSSFKNINCDEMIPCCCSECKNSKEPNFFEFKTLKKYIQKNSFFIKCDKSIEEVSISELLGNVTVKNDKSKESDVLEYLEKREFKVQVINNIKSDSSTMITDSFKQSQTTKITITQSIGEVTSTLSSLQKKVGGIDEKEEISDLITDFKKLGENPTKEAIKDSGVLTDLKGLITDFDEKMHNTGEVITQTTKAIRTAKALGRAYNDLASLCGLPTVPFFLLK